MVTTRAHLCFYQKEIRWGLRPATTTKINHSGACDFARAFPHAIGVQDVSGEGANDMNNLFSCGIGDGQDDGLDDFVDGENQAAAVIEIDPMDLFADLFGEGGGSLFAVVGGER